MTPSQKAHLGNLLERFPYLADERDQQVAVWTLEELLQGKLVVRTLPVDDPNRVESTWYHVLILGRYDKEWRCVEIDYHVGRPDDKSTGITTVDIRSALDLLAEKPEGTTKTPSEISRPIFATVCLLLVAKSANGHVSSLFAHDPGLPRDDAEHLGGRYFRDSLEKHAGAN